MTTLRTLAALAALAAAPASALAAAVDVTPSVAVTSFQSRLVETGSPDLLVRWGGPERVATTTLGGPGPQARTVTDGALQTGTFEGGGTVVRRAFAASPDTFADLPILGISIPTLLGQARAGATPLVAGRVGGRATLTGTIRLTANDCAGLRGGTRTIDLDARTLLPLRVVTRRSGARTQTQALTGLRVNVALAVSAFRPLRLSGDIFRADQGFRRVRPSATLAHLSYVPELPTALPSGFRRAVSGWAPRSGITGPEGSIPPRPDLFAAVYSRGVERIDITQRRAAGGDWPEDPFAGECQRQTTTAVAVGGIPATYSFGPETPPHLYWREGRVLFTVRGPFPAADLVAIAESLAPVR